MSFANAQFRYTAVDIGTLGGYANSAYAINKSGQVVGTSHIGSGLEHAFLYSGGTMRDLNDLVDTSSIGSELFEGLGINDAGQIIAQGWGGSRAFLLTPIPPPAILVSDGSFGFRTNHFGFNVGGAAGSVVVVDGSTNLVDWIALATNTLGGGPWYFSDASVANLAARFYRARLR